MNFIDAYEVAESETLSSAVAGEQPQQSLNEEVSQVLGQFNKFWGGFRKQASFLLSPNGNRLAVHNRVKVHSKLLAKI
jgi:hypothetical protein